MRNTWLAPLAIMLMGSAVSTVAYAVFASVSAALVYFFRSCLSYAIVLAGLWAVLRLDAFRAVVDRLTLFVPMIGAAFQDLAMNRFFHALNLLYSTGGQRVEKMIRLAAVSAGNLALRDDFLRAAKVVEAGGTVAEAFAAPACIPADYKAILQAGDEAGKLESALATISRVTGESVQHRLAVFQEVFFRLVAVSVIFSITMTIWSLVNVRR